MYVCDNGQWNLYVIVYVTSIRLIMYVFVESI